jgi:hypothetical protein
MARPRLFYPIRGMISVCRMAKDAIRATNMTQRTFVCFKRRLLFAFLVGIVKLRDLMSRELGLDFLKGSRFSMYTAEAERGEGYGPILGPERDGSRFYALCFGELLERR